MRRSGSTPTWTRLTPAEVGRKENTQAALPWVGQRLEQDGSAATEPAPALEVFADPELEASQAQDRQRLLGVQQVGGGRVVVSNKGHWFLDMDGMACGRATSSVTERGLGPVLYGVQCV